MGYTYSLLTQEQDKFVDDITLVAAHAAMDNNKLLSRRLCQVIESIWEGNTVYAILLAEEYGFSDELQEQMRELFEMRRLE